MSGEIPTELDPKMLVQQDGPHEGQIADKWLAQKGAEAREAELNRLGEKVEYNLENDLGGRYDPTPEEAENSANRQEQIAMINEVARRARSVVGEPDGADETNKAAVDAVANFKSELKKHN